MSTRKVNALFPILIKNTDYVQMQNILRKVHSAAVLFSLILTGLFTSTKPVFILKFWTQRNFKFIYNEFFAWFATVAHRIIREHAISCTASPAGQTHSTAGHGVRPLQCPLAACSGSAKKEVGVSRNVEEDAALISISPLAHYTLFDMYKHGGLPTKLYNVFWLFVLQSFNVTTFYTYYPFNLLYNVNNAIIELLSVRLLFQSICYHMPTG